MQRHPDQMSSLLLVSLMPNRLCHYAFGEWVDDIILAITKASTIDYEVHILIWRTYLQELLASVRDSCSSAMKLPPGFIRDVIVEQVGTDVSNKTAAMNLAVATQLSDRILDEVTEVLKVTFDRLVSANPLLFQRFCFFRYGSVH